jgi:hypothetical protein
MHGMMSIKLSKALSQNREKVTMSSAMSACLLVGAEIPGFQWTDFHEI